MECCKTSTNKRFSSHFSIDNILRADSRVTSVNNNKIKDNKFYSSCNSNYEDKYFLDDFTKTWSQNDFTKYSKLSELPLSLDRYYQTHYWIEEAKVHAPKSSSSMSSNNLQIESDLIPSPPSISPLRLSPNESANRQTMESLFLPNLNRSTRSSYGPFQQRRRSPGLRRSPYHSWDSPLSSSSDREGFLSTLPHLPKPLYYSPTNDDAYDDANQKGGQVRFTHSQSSELERVFSLQKYISPQERKQLARSLDLSERQVKTWFQNRRAKWRRIKLEDEMRASMSEKHMKILSTAENHANQI